MDPNKIFCRKDIESVDQPINLSLLKEMLSKRFLNVKIFLVFSHKNFIQQIQILRSCSNYCHLNQ